MFNEAIDIIHHVNMGWFLTLLYLLYFALQKYTLIHSIRDPELNHKYTFNHILITRTTRFKFLTKDDVN